MLCLDSDIIIDFIRGNEKVKEKIELYANDYEIVTTPINIYEILLNVKKKEEKEQIISFINNLKVVFMFKESGIESSTIYQKLEKKGKVIKHMDTLIAGTIISNKCFKILTHDKRHFGEVEGLEIIEI